jgi:hypothetical protein
MDWVSEIFKSALAAPLSSLSVVSGLFFLIISVAKLPRIETTRLGRFFAGVMGIVLFGGGATAKNVKKPDDILPDNPVVNPAPNPAPEKSSRREPQREDPPIHVVQPVPQIPRGNVQIAYAGDVYACLLQLNIKIGDRSILPTTNPAPLAGVPLGDQKYSVNGKITCGLGFLGTCNATGSGSLQIYDGAVINIVWQNTAVGQCRVTLA